MEGGVARSNPRMKGVRTEASTGAVGPGGGPEGALIPKLLPNGGVEDELAAARSGVEGARHPPHSRVLAGN